MDKKSIMKKNVGDILAPNDLLDQEKELGLTREPGPQMLFVDRAQVASRKDNLMLLRFFCTTPTGSQEQARIIAPMNVLLNMASLITTQSISADSPTNK